MPIRSLLIWGVIALVLVVLFAALQGQPNMRGAQELPYTGLMNRVNAGQIESVTTQGDTLVSHSKEGQEYVTYLPQGTMANVVQRLDAAKVNVDTKQPRQGPGIGDILLGVLPMLLFP